MCRDEQRKRADPELFAAGWLPENRNEHRGVLCFIETNTSWLCQQLMAFHLKRGKWCYLRPLKTGYHSVWLLPVITDI